MSKVILVAVVGMLCTAGMAYHFTSTGRALDEGSTISVNALFGGGDQTCATDQACPSAAKLAKKASSCTPCGGAYEALDEQDVEVETVAAPLLVKADCGEASRCQAPALIADTEPASAPIAVASPAPPPQINAATIATH